MRYAAYPRIIASIIGLMLLPLAAFAQAPVTLSPVEKRVFLGTSGLPLASGCVFTYIATTTTPQATYVDSGGVTQNTNPVILDAAGRADIWLDTTKSYKFKIVSAGGVNCAAGVTQWTVDNITALGASTILGANNVFTGNNTFSGTNTFSNPIVGSITNANTATTATTANATSGASTLLCKSFENIACVDQANSQGWAGADYGAWVMSAIAALPTVNGYKSGQVMLAPSTSVITQSSGVTISSPFISIIGPGPGALQINCTFNGNCWDIHTNPASIVPGLVVRGFSITGQGTTNANAVGLSIGDVIGSDIEDIDIDNFRGANSACVWFNNINQSFERNLIKAVHAGLSQATQLGCTKLYRWTQPTTAISSSFAHNDYIANKFSVLDGQTAFSVEGGNHSGTKWLFTGNAVTGTTATVLALSGLTFTGSGASFIDGHIDISTECTTPCTTAKLLNISGPNTIFIRSGPGFFDISGLMTSTIAGNLIRPFNTTLNSTSSVETWRINTFPTSGAAGHFDTFIVPTNASRSLTLTDPGASANWTFNFAAISAAFATATTAGTCVQNTTAVTGATTAMVAFISPVSTPGVGAVWSAFVSSAGNVTINECAVAASAGGAIAFNIRVIP